MRIRRSDMRRKTRVCFRLKISRYTKLRVLTFRNICVTIFVRLDKRNDEERYAEGSSTEKSHKAERDGWKTAEDGF